jgi:hypothetical protein
MSLFFLTLILWISPALDFVPGVQQQFALTVQVPVYLPFWFPAPPCQPAEVVPVEDLQFGLCLP